MVMIESFVYLVLISIALFIQALLVLTFFRMNSTLNRIDANVRLMAFKGDVLWSCPTCHYDNAYWNQKCIKCGASRKV